MTDHLTPSVRGQIEAHLGRALGEEELVTVRSLGELSAQQTAVVETLVRRHRLAALLYLRGVVEDVIGDDALSLIDKIRDTPPR